MPSRASKKRFEVNTRLFIIHWKLRARTQPVKIEAVPSGTSKLGDTVGSNREIAILLKGMNASTAKARKKPLLNPKSTTVAGQSR